MSCSRTHHSDATEARTSNPSVSSQALIKLIDRKVIWTYGILCLSYLEKEIHHCDVPYHNLRDEHLIISNTETTTSLTHTFFPVERKNIGIGKNIT